MSNQRGYGQNGNKLYSNITKPMSTWIQWTVNAADSGGLGVTGVKSNGVVEYVFMHTSQTAGVVNGFTNPNPVAGYAAIALKSTFNTFLGVGGWEIDPPSANTSTTSTTATHVHTITALGTATLAQWQAVGLPQGFTPTLGQTFVATATQTIGGSAHVGTPGVPTTVSVNAVGNPTTTVTTSNTFSNAGAQIILQFCAATNSSTTTLVAANPADSSVVRIQLIYDGSSVTIDGL